MIIALFPNEKKQRSYNIAIDIRKFLEEKGIEVVAEKEQAEKIGAKSIDSVPSSEIKFLISMGGDGTILRLSHQYSHLNAAIVGINLGHLGFMADIPKDDIYPSLTDLLDGKFVIDQRLMLQAGGLQAVNDLVIHRAHNYRLIDLSIHVDGQYFNTFTADGIVIATPNGSTAYSLAAGGPILSPSIDAIVITPICAHTISNRPIVLSPDCNLQIEYKSGYEPVEVRADGLDSIQMHSNQVLEVKRSPNVFKRVNFHRHDYFATLRTKLGWSGGLRA